MENAAMAAYLKDVENNTRDMTADRIIKEKLEKIDSKDITNSNRMPTAAPETMPRFKGKRQQHPQEIDPCDPSWSRNVAVQPRAHQPGENKAQGKSKQSKGKGKGKKGHEDDRTGKPIRKVWYEAVSPEGYPYYWNVDTNETVWEAPEEGYMTFAEQEEEAKEQALQQELLEQLDHEEAEAKAEILEEQRANDLRERMKEFRKREPEKTKEDDRSGGEKLIERESSSAQEEERPYRRDYSIPEKTHPYGPWQTVKIETKTVDLQLPQQKQVQLPTFVKSEPPPPRRTFKEKTVTRIDAGDSDDDGQHTTFKKRKFGNKNVRKRFADD